MKIKFTKMSGAGNDFVVIDNRNGRIRQRSRLAREVCDRFEGIGADGLLLLEHSERADFHMRYYNADGSYGGMCGNGGRCISWYAMRKKIAGRVLFFEALDHVYTARKVGGEMIALHMKNPRDARHELRIEAKGRRYIAEYIDTGAPHAVIPVRRRTLDVMDVRTPGRDLRYNKAFGEAGANINFIERTGIKSLKMRTYERGVEDETLSCGTGSVASSIVASMLWGMAPPVRVQTRSQNTLMVEFDRDGEVFENVVLTGPAKITFEGVINV